ncbi:chitin binding protein [Cryomyces antarcticus]
MHFSTALLSSVAVLPALVAAHGDGIPGAPRIFGRRNERAEVAARQSSNTSGRCGSGFGSCAAGYCCSAAGWCGQGIEYCASPGCQFQYGPACDDNTVPPGTSTSTIARPLLGSVPYGGAGIYDCTVPGTIAITYDDGPYIYTDHVLDILKSYNAKATFFITGNNNGKGEIDNTANPWATTIKRAYADGHQIASHTWTHPFLSSLTSAQRKQQMYSNEMALRNILGFFPTYMRPPYSDCTAASGCEADMKALGYHITYFDVDTVDYNNDSPTLIQNAKNNFAKGIAAGSPSTADYLVIGHDIHYQTAYNLTAYMLDTLLAKGYKPVTVGECLGDPQANWYRSAPGSVFTSATATPTSTSSAATVSPTRASTDGTSSSIAPSASATIVSSDATCGGTTGLTCFGSTFGNCCSVNGWCGSTVAYCGAGCQAGFGTCNPASSAAAPASPSTSTSQAVVSSAVVSSTVAVSSSASSTRAATSSTPAAVSSSAAPSASALKVSTDATCGGNTGLTCSGSTFGNCCSMYGWCGSTASYCGTGCQAGFGTCSTSTTTAKRTKIT